MKNVVEEELDALEKVALAELEEERLVVSTAVGVENDYDRNDPKSIR